MKVAAGQSWRLKPHIDTVGSRDLKVTGVGADEEFADAPVAFICSAGDVDASDGYQHDGRCCYRFVKYLTSDYYLVGGEVQQ